MGSIVEALDRLKWTKMATISEVSFPNLVKAFYVCLKSEADGTLTSMVKGTQIRVTRELLASLFGVGTSELSGVHTVNIQEKGLGIVGPEFRLKDDKVDAIKNQEINIAELMIDRMKFASAQLSMGSRQRLLWLRVKPSLEKPKKVEAVQAAAAPSVEAEPSAAVVVPSSRIEDIPPEDIEPVGRSSEDPLPSSRVGSVLREVLESIHNSLRDPIASEVHIAEAVASGHTEEVVMEEAPIQGEQEINVESDQVEDAPTQGELDQANEDVASGHNDVQMEDPPIQEEQTAAVHIDAPMEDAPADGEILGEKESEPQGERTENPPEYQFREGEIANSSESDEQDPMDKAREKGKEVASNIPLLADTPHQRAQKQKIIINLKPVIERLDAQGEILCSVQADVSSLFMSQASAAKELSQVKNAIRWFNKEMGSMKALLSDILKEVRSSAPSASPPPAAQPFEGTEEEVPRPSGSLPTEESGPSGPSTIQEAPRPTGPSAEGPTGPVEDLPGPTGPVEVLSEPTGPVETESEKTLAPPSPPSSSTAPPAPQPFKQPLPRVISSPAPFPSPSTTSPVSSTHIPPPPPLFEDPPASSSAGASSSSGPSSSKPTAIPSSTSHSLLHPSDPPSFITIIPEAAQINGPYLRGLQDEFEVAILQSILKIFSAVESQTKEQWAQTNKVLYNNFLLARSAKFPPRDHSLALSEWFLIHHKDSWAPFIQKEIKMIRYFKMFNDYRYLHRLPEIQLGQFIEAIRALGPGGAHTKAVQVDFATLQLPDSAFLPPLHSLIMDSSVGSIIFERFARVLGRIKVQKGYLVAFNRFLFREYHQGHVTADVLVFALSECERLSPVDWTKLYPLSAHQLSHVNESLAKEGQSQISAAQFLDMNSIHLVHDPYQTWIERYKVYVAMRMELKHKQNFYLVSMDQFLAYASFGKVSFLKISLDSDQYARLLDEQLVHHLRRMAPLIGPSYSIEPGNILASMLCFVITKNGEIDELIVPM
ncbi:hypothetical protein Taro_000689 [Colocasia esculenta]|uniref:Uncharacterized protein n=1 Tax=Colocasia esculenta TaxID=4460 RepID=A0A843TID5_COLES|nr:hypothetical protein [Colocasia esculenta]